MGQDGKLWVLNFGERRINSLKIDFHITDEKTGETRAFADDTEYTLEWDDQNQNPSLFIWEDGNYACDCNRALFFGYAKGEKYGDIKSPCGEWRYSVLGYDRETKALVFEDRRKPSKTRG